MIKTLGSDAISTAMHKVGEDQWQRSSLSKALGSDAIHTAMYKVVDQWQSSSLSKTLGKALGSDAIPTAIAEKFTEHDVFCHVYRCF